MRPQPARCYINALNKLPEYHEQLMQYDAFTDIMFISQKQINCQAEAAVFVLLKRLGLLERALKSKEAFLDYNHITFPKTEVGGRVGGYAPHDLDLSEYEQKFIYELCSIIDDDMPFASNLTPLLVMAICAHESS